jgi:hypothetical protein
MKHCECIDVDEEINNDEKNIKMVIEKKPLKINIDLDNLSRIELIKRGMIKDI